MRYPSGRTVTCPHCHAPLVSDARFCPACGKANAPTESGTGWPPAAGAPDLAGREIAGRYRLNKKLGEGGMGAVYRGEQMSLKRSVAVKLLKPELSSNQMILARFNSEAQLVAKLSHPNTVNIYDYGQDSDGTLFIAMEYIEGKSLREAIQTEGPFSLQRALAIALQVAASLSDAHSNSIVHRDLKPDNVMLATRGRHKDIVRVLDFGIAKLRDEGRNTHAAMTQAGDMLGTPQYMAPEQIKGEAIDGRCDVYALGCMIYEMITARLPFEAPSIMAMLSKHLVEDVIPPSQRRPELNLPPSIDQLVCGAMQKEPKDRAENMDAFADLITGLVAQLPADPNAANRSAGLSIQQGAVGALPTGAGQTPFYAPTTPPPGGPATGAHAFAPPMGPPPMGPPPGVPYVPPAHPQIAPTHFALPASSPAKSRAPLYAVLGVLAVAGAGIGIYFAKKDGSDKTVAANSGSAVDKPDSHEPIEVTPPDPPRGSAAKVDPWADNGTTANTPDLPKRVDPDDVDDPPDLPDPDDTQPKFPTVGTALMPIPAGASLSVPAGFAKMSETNQMIMYRQNAANETIIMAPLIAGTNDPKQLAARYTADTGATFVEQDSVVSAGAQRTAMFFTSENDAGPLLHFVVLYIAPAYRVGVLYIAPAAIAADTDFQARLDKFFRDGVRLP